MIHYHGTPTSGTTEEARKILNGRHGFVSFSDPSQISIVAEVCQDYALDCGAFTAWTRGVKIDFDKYYDWVKEWRLSNCNFAIIPDVIGGLESENDDLIRKWGKKFTNFGVPVWHMHETFIRLQNLCDKWPMVAIGSSGIYSKIGSKPWWDQMIKAMNMICDGGELPCKLHGLRMLDPEIFKHFPFYSADSTNVARNCHDSARWKTYRPPNNAVRGNVLAERIEIFQSLPRWINKPEQTSLI